MHCFYIAVFCGPLKGCSILRLIWSMIFVLHFEHCAPNGESFEVLHFEHCAPYGESFQGPAKCFYNMHCFYIASFCGPLKWCSILWLIWSIIFVLHLSIVCQVHLEKRHVLVEVEHEFCAPFLVTFLSHCAPLSFSTISLCTIWSIWIS